MFTSVVQEEMKKEHEKEHEKELQAIRVSNTVHKHNLTIYIRFALCYAMLCPVSSHMMLLCVQMEVKEVEEKCARQLQELTVNLCNLHTHVLWITKLTWGRLLYILNIFREGWKLQLVTCKMTCVLAIVMNLLKI